MIIRARLSAVTLTLAVILPAGRADAQCADGSPPPCRPQAVAAAPRRVNPPLDDRAWIVVPFDNLAKSPDVDWLRGASVNLLYLDMSRWKDIRVVDDERVADLVRETPEAANAQTLSLNAGLAVAKRAGAGRLVMGDILKLGSRTTVTAKVYDVRTGQRIRSVREETAVQDSVMPLFGKLARKVLNVAPPAGANVGALGTASSGAYQAYIEGVDALNRYDLPAAHARFDEAIGRDSSFALAHYKQSIVIGWENPVDPTRRAHAESANRLASSLPPRERTLILGQLQQTTGDWTQACDTYSGLVRQDSSDVEAWYGVGECLFHDPTMAAVGGDTTRLRFRADYDRSIRAFERVLQLDPTYHLAYQHIIDALASDRHPQGCFAATPGARCAPYTALLIRRGDSLVATPIAVADTVAVRLQGEEFVRTSSRRRNLDLARTWAEAWVQASPNEPQARRGLARILVLQGDVGRAAAEFAQIKTPGTLGEELRRGLEEMEIAYKRGKELDAVADYDRVRASKTVIPGTSFTFGNVISGYGPAFGRLTEFDSLLEANIRAARAPEFVLRYQHLAVRSVLTGIANDSLLAAEREAYQASLARSQAFATRSVLTTLAFALRAPRTWWPPVDTMYRDVRIAPAVALSRGDTARLRQAAQALDSVAALLTSAGVSDSGFAVIAADAWLVLHDTTSALRSLRFMLDRAVAPTSYFPQLSGQLPPVYFVPRAMLLRADLAARTGQLEEARTWYQRFVNAWSTAVPELQPIVDRAKQELAKVNARP